MDADGNNVVGLEVCGGELLVFISTNRSHSREYCTKLYQELFAPIQSKIEHEIETYTFNQLDEDIKKFNEAYSKRALGPEKWNVLNDLDKKTIETQKSNFKKLKGYQEKMLNERQKTKRAENEAMQKKEELEKMHQAVVREKEKHLENVKNMEVNFQNQIDKVLLPFYDENDSHSFIYCTCVQQ